MLYYIHGYMSEPNSTKGTLFKERLNAKAIKYRDCEPENLKISDCLVRINQEIENDENAILIGSSLGGLLAAKTALDNTNVKQIILLNPAIIPRYVDISKIQGMPQEILADMQDYKLFENKINAKINILAGSMDNVFPNKWVEEFAKVQDVKIRYLDDDHSFSLNLQVLPQIISEILQT
jgi:predicted esterase YcpF (UPF0227 family)